jgi:hypothetical protein
MSLRTRYLRSGILIVSVTLTAPVALGASRLVPTDVTVGQHLEATSHITLTEAAPIGGLQIKLVSNNPTRLLLSKTPDGDGLVSITLNAPQGRNRSEEFYVYGLGSTGTATYTASAPGFVQSEATVTLAPSGIVLKGPYGLGSPLVTTTGAGALHITVYSALLGPSGEYIAPQPVAGGHSVSVVLNSSNPLVGAIADSPVKIAGGSNAATTKFQPAAPGKIVLSASVPPGFTVPAQYATMAATVITPGISLTDQVAVGRNLQVGGTLSLGQPAPEGGVQVTLTSSNPNQLLLSTKVTDMGSNSITIYIPAGGANATYYVQALSDSGMVTYTANAPGYTSRTATVALTPSGVVIGLEPPDEAEVLRKEAPQEPHGLLLNLSTHRPLHLNVYLVQLDPRTHRGADITVQALRPGLSVAIEVASSNPGIGTIGSPITIRGGESSAATPFAPLREGSTVISAITPAGFTTAQNSTSLTVIVKP